VTHVVMVEGVKSDQVPSPIRVASLHITWEGSQVHRARGGLVGQQLYIFCAPSRGTGRECSLSSERGSVILLALRASDGGEGLALVRA